MKRMIHVCDICKENKIGDDGDIRLKYRAKRKWWLWYESGWDKLEICANCLNKIIAATKESDNDFVR